MGGLQQSGTGTEAQTQHSNKKEVEASQFVVSLLCQTLIPGYKFYNAKWKALPKVKRRQFGVI